MSETIRIVVLGEPPSGNHYKNFRVIEQWVTRNGRRVKVPIPMWYHTDQAKHWWANVDRAAGGRQMTGKAFEVSYIVFQGPNSRGDVDNYAKTIFDSLVRAKVIPSDAAVTDMHGHKRRDRQNPRTVIQISCPQQHLF